MRRMSIDSDLKKLRDRIDRADDKIVEGLIERMGAVEEIKDLKSQNDLEVHDERRVREILDTRAAMGGKNLRGDFMRELFALIIKYSERLQKE